MKRTQTIFDSLPLDASGTVSWIHIGDTHISRAGQANEVDLGRIVDEINEVFALGGVDFVFVPGDIADDGSVVAYEVFRSHLDRLKLPWCAIVGDHDVHERSFANFQKYICPELYGSFAIGNYRFFRLNAFSEPRPDAFIVGEEQVAWLETELKFCEANGLKAVIFLHCYPSELKQGADELRKLLQRYPVLLVDMGHTHYNEISNDGTLLYTATRSTGQIEEGAAGYSLTTLDGNSISWHFVSLGSPSLIAITQPVDERLLTNRMEVSDSSPLHLRAKVWSAVPLEGVEARFAGHEVALSHQGGVVWSADMDPAKIAHGVSELMVAAKRRDGEAFASTTRVGKGPPLTKDDATLDQENAIGEWTERGILGTQLGPNKNGRKW